MTMRVRRRSFPPNLRSWLSLWIPLALLTSLVPMTKWLGNRYEVTVQDIVLPLILTFLLSIVLTAAFFKFFKKEPLAGLVGAVLSALILGQGYVDRFNAVNPLINAFNPIPQLDKYKGYEEMVFTVSFVLIVILLTAWFGSWFARYVQNKGLKTADLQGGIVIAIGTAFIIQAFTTSQSIAIEWQQFFYRPPQLTNQIVVGTKPADKPDIYYIVLDRYTSQTILKDQFGYGNSAFTNFLTSNQFDVVPDAHANYPYTTMSISSTLTADYHTDQVEKFAGASQQTVEPFHDSIRYSSVIEQFKSLGYSYDELGSWYEASNQAPLADHVYQPDGILTVFGKNITLNTFSKSMLTGSVFWQFVQHGLSIGHFNVLSYSGLDEADATAYKINTLNQLASQPAGGRFIFSHILVPHDPYYFNADGSRTIDNGNNNVGEPIKQKYLGQVQYISDQIKGVVSNINKASDNKAVIIIQSDEGPYPMVLNGQNFDGESVGDELSTGSMLDWSDTDLKMKYGILAAYHVPGASAADLAKAGDSVNIFRLVLNTYFDAQMPYLPRCYYAYKNGREESFVFSDISQRLTGTANPACSETSDFSAEPTK